jgi:hypothetical protein
MFVLTLSSLSCNNAVNDGPVIPLIARYYLKLGTEKEIVYCIDNFMDVSTF